jgi:hypothetical protein
MHNLGIESLTLYTVSERKNRGGQNLLAQQWFPLTTTMQCFGETRLCLKKARLLGEHKYGISSICMEYLFSGLLEVKHKRQTSFNTLRTTEEVPAFVIYIWMKRSGV